MGKIFPLLIGVGLLSACSNFIRLPDPPPEYVRAEEKRMVATVSKQAVVKKTQDPDVLVWLIADKLHTGMVFPYDWLIESGFVPPSNFGHPRFVTLSWGNRTAYVQRALHTPGQVFQALFTNSPAVMELIPVYYEVVDQCPHQRIWRKLVPREKGRELAVFLNWCSVRDAKGQPVVCGTSSWGGGVLLESRHTYYFPRICNIWTVQAMETLGPPMNAWRGIFADGVVRQAEKPEQGYEQIWFGSGEKPGPSLAPIAP